MTGTRIDFDHADVALFHQQRDLWRDVAAGFPLSKIGLKVASILPKYLSREKGYCFPTDDDLAETLNTTTRSVGRGMMALEEAGLIERETTFRQDKNREASGRIRRIFLCLPSERTEDLSSERTNSERTGESEQTVPGSERTETGLSERTYGCPNNLETTLDKNTPEKGFRSGRARLASTREKPVPSPRINPHTPPRMYVNDHAFLEAFDQCVREVAGSEIGAGEIDRITAEAFDRATNSTSDFMPFHWADLCLVRIAGTRDIDPEPAEWFRFRASTIIHRREAA